MERDNGGSRETRETRETRESDGRGEWRTKDSRRTPSVSETRAGFLRMGYAKDDYLATRIFLCTGCLRDTVVRI